MTPTTATAGRAAARARRAYLGSDDRRVQLLDAAASVAGRHGLAGVTMAAVAAEAGVSRQWLYEHFGDLGELYRALLVDRFSALELRAGDGVAPGRRTDIAEGAARRLFALPTGDRRILRALVAGLGSLHPELAAVEAELRERIFERWVPLVRRPGADTAETRTLVWAVINAVFGLADQVERREVDPETAVGVLRRLLRPLPAGAARPDKEPHAD